MHLQEALTAYFPGAVRTARYTPVGSRRKARVHCPCSMPVLCSNELPAPTVSTAGHAAG